MPTDIVPKPLDGELILAGDKQTQDAVSRINKELSRCDDLQRQGNDARKAVAAQVVKQWEKTGRLFEKEKAKLDARNQKAQEYNRKAGDHNRYHEKMKTGKKPIKLKPITRWESLFSGENSGKNATELPSDSVGKTPENNRFSCSTRKAERLRKVAQYPKLATTSVIASSSYDINPVYKSLSDATPEAEEEAKLSLSPKTLAHHFTGNDEWYTPEKYIEAAREVMGSIDTDPASNDEAQGRVRAGSYYTADNCGLTQSWSGNVWMNPPYSKDLMPRFMAKLMEEWHLGNIEQAIVLTNNNTDTKWFQDAARESAAICFTTGRIGFYHGDTISAPTNGQSFFYFGPDCSKFASVFSSIGWVASAAQ